MRVAVVGPCASGKSSLVAALQELRYDAYSVAQEHSAVAELWRRQLPDVVIYLNASLTAIRARRDNPDWPRWIYDLQLQRLASAREHASLSVDTDKYDEATVAALVTAFLAQLGA